MKTFQGLTLRIALSPSRLGKDQIAVLSPKKSMKVYTFLHCEKSENCVNMKKRSNVMGIFSTKTEEKDRMKIKSHIFDPLVFV